MFEGAADAYDRFMGRYSRPLAPAFADFAGAGGGRVLDVGCGPGALTAELVARGAEVSAVEPSESFFAAVRERFPGVDAHHGTAEALPFGDGEFDAALAQLVVHFMADPVAGIAEMARVTRPGGTVAACVWDLAGGRSPLSPLWAAVDRAGLSLPGERTRPGAAEGSLRELFEAAGVADVVAGEVSASIEHASFEEWWGPFTLGVGPAGQALQQLEPAEVEAIREEARALLGAPPFRVQAVAWAARGAAPDTEGVGHVEG
jgi:SAM-dependent methyltransferase